MNQVWYQTGTIVVCLAEMVGYNMGRQFSNLETNIFINERD